MPGLPHRAKLESLIAQAMKDNAPTMYRDLLAQQKLRAVLRERAEQAEQSFDQAMSQERTKALSGPMGYQESVSSLTQGRDRAARIAIAQAVEFPPAPNQPQPMAL